MEFYARKNSPGSRSKPSGREIFVIVGIGADGRVLNVCRLKAQLLQLQLVAKRQVEVPFFLSSGYLLHGKSGLCKSLIHLVAHLEMG